MGNPRLDRLRRAVAALVILIGALTLLGWAVWPEMMASTTMWRRPMPPLSAVVAIASAVALVARPAVSRLLAVAIMLVGLAFSVALLTYPDALAERARSVPPATIMVSLITSGVALLLRDARAPRSVWVMQGLATVGMLNALRELLGLIPAEQGAFVTRMGPVAAPTGALSILLVGVGLLLARPDAGPMALLLSERPGGRLLRWLIAAGIFGPLGAGLVTMLAWNAGIFGAWTGLVLVLGGNLVVFYLVAAAYDRADRARQAAEEHLATANADLERRVAERTVALAEREAQISAIGDNLPGVMIYQTVADETMTFRFTYLSAGVERISGLVATTVLEQPELLYAQLTPETRELLAAAEAEAARTFSGLDVEVQKQTPWGLRWSRIRSRPRRLAEGQVVWDGIEMDITEAKRVEAERLSFERKLLETQRMESLGVLAGGVAHDFNNILAAILGHAELARLDVAPGSEASASLDAIILGATRAADLTAQMLAYAGRGRLITEVVDLNQAARELRELTRATLPRGVSVRLGLTPYLALVAADGTQVRQVLLNLLTNASEAIVASGEEGSIFITTGRCVLTAELLAHATISAASPGPHGFIEVSDTGNGIDPEAMARIFDPFFSTKFTGRGLGLAAVQGIVRAHHGALFVRSTPGRGATFRACFPLASAAAGDMGEPGSPTLSSLRDRVS